MNANHIFKQLNLPVNLDKGINISEENFHMIFKCGCDFYKKGRYKDASDIFLLLVVINPRLVEPWLSLGYCEQNQKNYADAIKAYEMAVYLDKSLLVPYYYLAECALELNNYDDAAFYADRVIKKSYNIEGYESIHDKAKKMLDSIKLKEKV
jgi:type III secretion system low calcium response chaperone LcrH/SycD